MPVVDESDFSLDIDDDKGKDSNGTPGVSGDQKESFDSLMKSAEKFALKKDRSKKTRSNAITLEDDLQGLSLEDDEDLSVTLMSRARTGKTDVSLAGRVTKWAEETKDLITNPTPVQITYSLVFFSSVAFLFLLGLVAAAMGAFKLRGDGVDVEIRRQRLMQDPFTVNRAAMMDYKRRAQTVRNIRDLGNFKEEVAKAREEYVPPSAPEPVPDPEDAVPVAPAAAPVAPTAATVAPEAAPVSPAAAPVATEAAPAAVVSEAAAAPAAGQ